jgi:hypothetical protein
LSWTQASLGARSRDDEAKLKPRRRRKDCSTHHTTGQRRSLPLQPWHWGALPRPPVIPDPGGPCKGRMSHGTLRGHVVPLRREQARASTMPAAQPRPYAGRDRAAPILAESLGDGRRPRSVRHQKRGPTSQ